MPVTRISGLGIHLPERRVSTRELLADHLAAKIPLERVTGIFERRLCGSAEDALSLAVEASRRCLRVADREATELSWIIYAGISHNVGGLESFQFQPPLSVLLRDALGASCARTFDLSNACGGMLTAVAVLDTFVRAAGKGAGLVVSGEFASHVALNARDHVSDLLHPEVASLTLGDAGAAMLVEPAGSSGGGILATEFVMLSEHSDLCVGFPCPDAPGGAIRTDAVAIHRAMFEAAPFVIRRALDRAGLDLQDIALVIPHQTSLQSMRAGREYVEKELGNPSLEMVENLASFGNTASTTHALALQQVLETGRLGANDRIVLLGFGSGVMLGAVVMELGDLGERIRAY